MKFNVIFISGVHGVGKGTFCEKIVNQLGFPHYSASTLIKNIKKSEVDMNKIVIDADKNQDYLITALENLNVDTDFIIVDGHFCLQGEKEIIEIPLQTFQEMELAAIVLLTDDPIEIYTRMHARDNCSLNVDIISTLQEGEKERAGYVADFLDIPIIEAKINDHQEISRRLSSILN